MAAGRPPSGSFFCVYRTVIRLLSPETEGRQQEDPALAAGAATFNQGFGLVGPARWLLQHRPWEQADIEGGMHNVPALRSKRLGQPLWQLPHRSVSSSLINHRGQRGGDVIRTIMDQKQPASMAGPKISSRQAAIFACLAPVPMTSAIPEPFRCGLPTRPPRPRCGMSDRRPATPRSSFRNDRAPSFSATRERALHRETKSRCPAVLHAVAAQGVRPDRPRSL